MAKFVPLFPPDLTQFIAEEYGERVSPLMISAAMGKVTRDFADTIDPKHFGNPFVHAAAFIYMCELLDTGTSNGLPSSFWNLLHSYFRP